MRFVAGGDLKTLLVTSGPLSPERAIAAPEPVARALDAAHAHGLVHRDVKPANILLQRSPSGEIEHVYLSDFGVMKHATSISGLTKTGALVGTVDYMAPEQIEGHDVSAQTDVYALACLFYQCDHGPGSATTARPRRPSLWAHMRDDFEPASQRPAGAAGRRSTRRSRGRSRRTRRRGSQTLRRSSSTRAAPRPPPARAAPSGPDWRSLAGATVAERCPAAPDRAGPPASAPSLRPEPERGPSAPSRQPRPGPCGAGPAAPGARGRSAGERGRSGGAVRLARRWWVGGRRGARAGGGIAAAVALTVGRRLLLDDRRPAPTASPRPSLGVPDQPRDGTGDATVTLDGDTATITVDTNGLLDAAPHAMHIHAGGQGKCPTAQAAHRAQRPPVDQHGQRRALLRPAGDGDDDHGRHEQAEHPGLPPLPARRATSATRARSRSRQGRRSRSATHKASVIVHGIDYNNNGLYDSVLDRSELDRAPAGRGDRAGALRSAACRPRTRRPHAGERRSTPPRCGPARPTTSGSAASLLDSRPPRHGAGATEPAPRADPGAQARARRLSIQAVPRNTSRG